MKLLLTSNGLTNQKLINNFVELAGDTKTKKLLCVTTGPDNLKINGFIKEALKPFIEAGIHRKNVKIYYLCKEDSVNVNEFDIILVCGGNTYDYLRMIKDWGLDKGIIKFIKQDKLYIGISAGSMITGPSIEGLSRDVNKGLKDFNALNLTSISIRPHYEKLQDEWLNELRNKFKKLIAITDGQAVIVTDYDKYEVI